MNLIALIDLAGVLVLLVSIVLMLRSWKTLVQRAEKGLIVLLIALGALLVNTGNFLEWAGITSSMDPLEDYLQILIVALWGFVFVTIFYERAQEAAWKSESRFKNLLEHTADAVFLHDREGQILDVNTHACVSLGYTRDELLALKVSDFDVSEFASEDELQEFWKGVHAGVRSTAQGLHQRKDGSTFPVEVRVGHIPSEEQALFVAIARDITQQVEKDRKLQKTAERYRLLADNASDVIWTMDLGFNYIYISPSVQRQRGLTVEEALAQPFDKAVTKESMDRTRNIFAEEMTRDGLEGVDLKRARTLELEYFHKDGHIIIGEVTANLLRDENGKAVGIIGTTRDITERKRAEEAYKESEKRFRTAFRTSPDAITINRMADGVYVDVNDGFNALSGYDKSEVIGVSSLEINIWADPGDRLRLVEGLKTKGMVNNMEADFCRKDGIILPGLISARIIDMGDEPYILTWTRVITDLKQAEARIKNSLEEKEVLLKEIHHRVKNNLQVISGLLNLQAQHITDEKSREIYKESQNRVISMALIHEELYQARDLARVDFAAYIRNLAKNLFASYGMKSGNVKLVLETDEMNMVVDTAIPCGLIINELISNALKHAFPNGSEGEIRVRFHETEEGEYELLISDNGVGLPEGLDIWQTSSLGMQLVTVLTSQLGGELNVRSDEGTEFSICFKEYLEAGTALY